MSLYNCTCTWSTSTCNDSFKLSEISDYPRLLVTCTSLTVCLLCIHLAHGRQTPIEVFNNMQTLKFKAQLTIGFFAAVNHNYGDCQWTLKHRQKQTKWIEIYQSRPKDATFWPGWSELLFPERSVSMIDGSKKRKLLLRFEFQSLHVIVNRNNFALKK